MITLCFLFLLRPGFECSVPYTLHQQLVDSGRTCVSNYASLVPGHVTYRASLGLFSSNVLSPAVTDDAQKSVRVTWVNAPTVGFSFSLADSQPSWFSGSVIYVPVNTSVTVTSVADYDVSRNLVVYLVAEDSCEYIQCMGSGCTAQNGPTFTSDLPVTKTFRGNSFGTYTLSLFPSDL